MRDFLPEDVRRREYAIGIITRVYERYGFEPLETPAVENIETLLGTYGEEGNQLIFKILKRGEHEATGQADLALRYDLTVPLARVVAQYQSRLPRLFKRYQIQPVWRADRPARGRFREFYQCDVDSLGSTSPMVEAELCAAMSDALTELGFNDFVIRINHRQFLAYLLNTFAVPRESHADALVAIDKLDKIGGDGVLKELLNRGISEQSSDAMLQFFEGAAEIKGSAPDPEENEAALDVGRDRLPIGSPGRDAVENIRAILRITSGTSAEGRMRLDFSLARGLSYYTGAIMEINVADLAGSLGGGGRYDNLVGMFLGQNIPACGFSLGLERILVVMGERNMFPPTLKTTAADVMIATFDAAGAPAAMRLAAQLREAGLRVLVYPDPEKIGKQIKYADSRGIPFVALLGENEIRDNTVTVKNLAAQTQDTYGQADAGATIVEALRQRG
ncbi:MAG: histidine--tRNA ligase [Acidobacteria bacterium]|nr:MAG: histidine--tRNA ligase [Acidobacteriota bacterium]